MRNILGNAITLSLFGESHGEMIGAVIDGLTPGIAIDESFIKECLAQRRPSLKGETSRVEKDEFKILSGVYLGHTTGAPLTIVIPNQQVSSQYYEKNKDIARPSHVDYVANEKYHGFQDYRGGGHFSGRVTAAIVASGAILLQALKKFNIQIGSHILKCNDILDRNFKNMDEDIRILENKDFPVLDSIEDTMKEKMEQAKLENDSIGGIVETMINHLPVGLGEPWFNSLEGSLAQAIFGIGGIKGISFGLGFDFANQKGSTANDAFCIRNGKVRTSSNHNGGINGGISNGMPVVFQTAIRPTPSIGKTQKTIHMKNKEQTTILINGRHDPAIIRRICMVITSMSALVIADQLAIRYGNDVFLKEHLD